jgi:hypothetical protein
MSPQDYKDIYSKAKTALEKLHSVKANLEEKTSSVNAEIEAMTQTVNAIAPIIGAPSIPTIKDMLLPPGTDILKAAGITVAVRALFDNKFSEDLSAPMVRDMLQEQGWDWSNYVNPLSTIHTVLKRLLEAGAIKDSNSPGLSPGKKYHSGKREMFQKRVSTAPPPLTTL